MLTTRPRSGADFAEQFLAELRAAQDDENLAELTEVEPDGSFNEYESANFVINHLAAIRYALTSGMPVIAWTEALKNEAGSEFVLRAVRQFEEQAKLLMLGFTNGLLSLDQLRTALVREFRRQSRNSYIAGRRTMGDLSPLSDAEDATLADIYADDSDDLDAALSIDPAAAAAAGGGLVGAVASMVFDPSNYLGSGLPGDPFAGLPAPIGAGKKSAEQLAKDAAKKAAKLGPDAAGRKFENAMADYGDRIRAMSHAGEMSALAKLPENSTLVWWTLGAADHCIDCLRLADMSPFYLSTMQGNGIYPGSGHTRCGGRCHCGLDYDIPAQVCGDPLLGDNDVLVEASRPTADGTRLNVWVQEAASCSLPINVDALQAAEDYSLIDDDEAFSWDADVADLIDGDLADTIDWQDVVAKTMEPTLGKQLRKGFEFLANDLGPAASDIRLTRYTAQGSEYVVAWRRSGGSVIFDAGMTLVGPTTLDADFTLRALHDLAQYAKEEGLTLTVSGDYAGPGLTKWLATLGSPQTVAPGAPPTMLLDWTSLPKAPAASPGIPLIAPIIPPPAGPATVLSDAAPGLGGLAKKRTLTDANGDEWLWKAAQFDPGSIPGEVATSQLGKALGLNVVDVTTHELKGKIGTVQRLLPDVETRQVFEPWAAAWTPAQVAEEARQHVFDWMLGNGDAHIGNMVIDKAGRLIGVDKSQAIIGIPIEVAHHSDPTLMGGAWSALFHANHTEQLAKWAPGDVLDILAKIDALPDAEFMDLIDETLVVMSKQKFVLGTTHTPMPALDELRAMALKRKQGIRSSMETVYRHELAKYAPADLPEHWRAWLDDGGWFDALDDAVAAGVIPPPDPKLLKLLDESPLSAGPLPAPLAASDKVPALAAVNMDDWPTTQPWERPASDFRNGLVPGFKYEPEFKAFGQNIAARADYDAILVTDAWLAGNASNRAFTLYHEVGHYTTTWMGDVGPVFAPYKTASGSYDIPWYSGQGTPLAGGHTVPAARLGEVVADVYADTAFGGLQFWDDFSDAKKLTHAQILAHAKAGGLPIADTWRIKAGGVIQPSGADIPADALKAIAAEAPTGVAGATPTTPAWANAGEMIADLEARYPGASFKALAGLDFKTTRVLAEQMDEVLTRFGAPPSFKGVEIIPSQKGGALASVGKSKTGEGSAITLPASLWKDREKIETLAKSQASGTWSTATKVLAANPGDVDGYVRSIITHELGHEYMGLSLFSRFGVKGDPVREAVDRWFKGSQEADAKGGWLAHFKKDRITEYGAKNPHESWAEMFTAALGQPPVASPDVAKLRSILDEFYPPGEVAIGPLIGTNVGQVAGGLTSRYQKWWDALSAEQRAALDKYKAGASDAINDLLRGTFTPEQAALSKALGTDLDALVAQLDSTFEDVAKRGDPQVIAVSTQTQKPLLVYRGRSVTDIPVVGDLVHEPGYLSTTVDPKVAAQFATGVPSAQPVVYRIALPKGERAAWMDDFIGKHGAEYELLLPRNGQFRVVATHADTVIDGTTVTVIDMVPEPKALVPHGPPIAAETNAWKPGDAQQYLLDPALPPLNAPLAEWSGHIPVEPELPPLKATAEEIADAKAAGAAARIHWDDEGVMVAVSWSADETKAAVAAGWTYEKIGNARIVAKDAADLDPLRAYASIEGQSSSDDAFWALLGYDAPALDARDLADTIGKGKRLTAGVMVFEPDGHVWVLAPKNKFAGYENTVIKGGVDADETAAAAAIRELREEAGLSAELDGYLGDYTNADGTGITRMYVGHRTGGGPLFADTKETYRVRLLTADEAAKALTRYGKPDVRDQAILADAVEAVLGKPQKVDYLVPADELAAFGSAVTPATVVPPAVAVDAPVPANPTAFSVDAIVPEPPPATAAFGIDSVAVANLTNVVDIPPSTKFPIARTRWTVPGGEVQPMYWKIEQHGGGLDHVFWMNSKKQVVDPAVRLNVHIAQLLRHADYVAANPLLAGLRVNEALLDQVPKLREMLIAAGATKPSPKTLELSAQQLDALAHAIKSNGPLPSAPALFETAPLVAAAVPSPDVVATFDPAWVPTPEPIADALPTPGVAIASPVTARARISTETAAGLKVNALGVELDNGVITERAIWEADGKSAVFVIEREAQVLTWATAAMDLPATGSAGRSAMVAAELRRLADVTEVYPGIERLQISLTAFNAFPTPMQNLILTWGKATPFGAELTSEQLRGLRDALASVFPAKPLPTIEGAIPEALGYSTSEAEALTGATSDQVVSFTGSSEYRMTTNGWPVRYVQDDLSDTLRLTSSVLTDMPHSVAIVTDLALRAATQQRAAFIVAETLVTPDMAAAMVAAGAERLGGVLVVRTKADTIAFVDALMPPVASVPVAVVPQVTVPPGEGAALLAGAASATDAATSFDVGGVAQAMKRTAYPATGGGEIVWRRWSNTLEVHSVETSSLNVIRAHIVRMAQAADAAPKIEALRFTQGAVAAFKGTDIDSLLLDAGAKVYPGGYRLTRDQLLDLRDKLVMDAAAVAEPPPAAALTLLTAEQAAAAHGTLYTAEPLKWFTRFHYATSATPVTVVQRDLAKQVLWARTIGNADLGERFTASVLHMIKIAKVDMASKAAIDSIRFENLQQLPDAFRFLLKQAGATGTDDVLILAREDALKFAQQLSDDVYGSAVTDAVAKVVVPDVVPPVTDAAHGLIGLAGHDPATLDAMQKAKYTGFTHEVFSQSYIVALTVPSGKVNTWWHIDESLGHDIVWGSTEGVTNGAHTQAAFLRQLELHARLVADGKFEGLRIGPAAFVGQTGQEMRDALIGLGAEVFAGDVVIRPQLALKIADHIGSAGVVELTPLPVSIATPIAPVNAVTAGASLGGQFGYDAAIANDWKTFKADWTTAAGPVLMEGPGGYAEGHYITGFTGGIEYLILQDFSGTTESAVAMLAELSHGASINSVGYVRINAEVYANKPSLHDLLLAAGGDQMAYGVEITAAELDKLVTHIQQDSALHVLPAGSGRSGFVPKPEGTDLSAYPVGEVLGTGVVTSAGVGTLTSPSTIMWGTDIETKWATNGANVYGPAVYAFNGMSGPSSAMVETALAQLHSIAGKMSPGDTIRITPGVLANGNVPQAISDQIASILYAYGGTDLDVHIELSFEAATKLKEAIDNQVLGIPVTNLVDPNVGPGGFVVGDFDDVLTELQSADYYNAGNHIAGVEFDYGGGKWIGSYASNAGQVQVGGIVPANWTPTLEQSNAVTAAFIHKVSQEAYNGGNVFAIPVGIEAAHPGIGKALEPFGGITSGSHYISPDQIEDMQMALAKSGDISFSAPGPVADAPAIATTAAGGPTIEALKALDKATYDDLLAVAPQVAELKYGFVNYTYGPLDNAGTVKSRVSGKTLTWESISKPGLEVGMAHLGSMAKLLDANPGISAVRFFNVDKMPAGWTDILTALGAKPGEKTWEISAADFKNGLKALQDDLTGAATLAPEVLPLAGLATGLTTPATMTMYDTQMVANALASGSTIESLYADTVFLPADSTFALRAPNGYTVGSHMQGNVQVWDAVVSQTSGGLSGMLAMLAASKNDMSEGALIEWRFRSTVLDATPGLRDYLKTYGTSIGQTDIFMDSGQAAKLVADLADATAHVVPAVTPAAIVPGPTVMPLHQKVGLDGALIQKKEISSDGWPTYSYGSYKYFMSVKHTDILLPNGNAAATHYYVSRQKQRVLWYYTQGATGTVNALATEAAAWHALMRTLKHAADTDLPLFVTESAARKAGKVGDILFAAGAVKKDKYLKYGPTWVLDKAKVKKLLAEMEADPLVPMAIVTPGPSAAIDTIGKAALPEPAPAVAAIGTPVPKAVGPASIADTYGFDAYSLKSMGEPGVAVVGTTPHGNVTVSTIYDSDSGKAFGTVRWAEEKFGEAFVLRIRDASAVGMGTGKASGLAGALMAIFPEHMAGAKWSQLLIDKKALDGTKLGDMLAAFGAKEAKTYWRLTEPQVVALAAALKADTADWVGTTIIPKLVAAVPTSKVALVAGVPSVPTPGFVYGFDPVQVHVWMMDAPVKHSGLINTGETKDILSPLGSTAGLAWSVSPSGKAIGVFDVIAGASPAETRDAAFAMLRHVIAEGQSRWTGAQQGEKLFFKPDAYDKVPGLRQLLIDAGGKPTQYPKLGEAIELDPAQAQVLLDALTSNTLGVLKVSIAKTSEYLGFDSAGLEKLLAEEPKATTGGWQWEAAGDKVQTQVSISGDQATFSGLAGGGTVAHVMATVAELNHIADIGINRLTIGSDVLGLVPKLDKFLLANGGEVVGDTIVLDAVALNNVRKAISKDALPVLLGGKPLPFSVVDELAANVTDATTATLTIIPKGTNNVVTATVKGVPIPATITVGPSNIYWKSIDAPASATVGNVRAASAAHLRSLVNWAAQDASISKLEIDVAVFAANPGLRAVLLKYGASETSGAQHYLSLTRTQIAKLRKDIEAEFAAFAPTGTSYIGKQAAAINWPAADELTSVPLIDPVTGKPLSGQTAKNLFTDKDGNQWLFKPGDSGRGAVTDKATAELARLLGLPVPPVRQYTVVINGKTVSGSLQKMLPNAKSIKSLSELSPTQTSEMLRHSVLDWLTNNDDAHIGNWLIDSDGHLWSIDKTRSWTTFNDGAHDLLRTANEGNGGGTPLMFKFWRDAQQNPKLLTNIKPQDIAPTLRAIRNLSDEEFRRIVEPVAAAMNRGKYAGKPAQLIEAMLARKHEMASDFEAYFRHEVEQIAHTKPGELPPIWKKWLDEGGTFNLDATPRDLWQERLAELNGIFGDYSPNAYTAKSHAGHLAKVRSEISSYFGSGAAGHKSGQYGSELIRPRLNPAQEAEWRQLQEWAMLNIVNDPLLSAPNGADQAALLRRWFNPETGKFKLIRSTNRYSSAAGRLDDPRSYVAGMLKDGLRNMLGTSMGTHTTVAAHGGVFYYIEVNPDQVFSSWALGYGYGASESEILAVDVTADQVVHIRSQNQRLDLQAWQDWEGGPVYVGSS